VLILLILIKQWAMVMAQFGYLSIFLEMRLDIISIGQIDKCSLHTIVASDLGEVAISATVHVIHRDNMWAGLQAVDDSGSSGWSRAECKTMLCSLK
jgi:hypothetical protein